MTYSHAITQQQRTTTRKILTVMRNMEDATILYIRLSPDLYLLNIATDHAHRPDRRLGSNSNIADYDSCIINPGIFCYVGCI